MDSKNPALGFMQGRLSPLINGKIQAFPWDHWRAEFGLAERLGFRLMEWTLDHERLKENPLLTPEGRSEIRRLSSQHGVRIETLTGDLFMQAPFWKAEGRKRDLLLSDLDAVLDACAELGIAIVVVPLVDGGSLENASQEAALEKAFLSRIDILQERHMAIAFESDFNPARLAKFIARFPGGTFGINYDTGNSAALGFEADSEIEAYGPRVMNVHLKDRLRGGGTVPLGTGAADLPRSVRVLGMAGYRGRFILQTARAADGDHAGVLARYRTMSIEWLEGAR
jgi:L-ribulose-5-phosphate 3-epimerase